MYTRRKCLDFYEKQGVYNNLQISLCDSVVSKMRWNYSLKMFKYIFFIYNNFFYIRFNE